MFERHQTKIAVFGGKPGEIMEYKGMAGNQVLEWSDLDTEIKSVGLDNVSTCVDAVNPPHIGVALKDPLAPPRFVSGSLYNPRST